MEKLRHIFDVFSRRRTQTAKLDGGIPVTFRTRLLQWCAEDLFSDPYQGDRVEFFGEMHKFLRMRHGRPRLASGAMNDEMQDLAAFWQECSTEHFLDIVEYVCKLADLRGSTIRENDIVEAINNLLSLDDLPYYLTKFVHEKQTGARTIGKFDIPMPAGGVTIVTISYPQIILREDEVTHSEMIVPALDLLAHPTFKNANNEYREALQHYRRGEYGDALTKAGSAFESVMKIICDLRGWTYHPKATAAPLVKLIVQNTGQDTFLEQLLVSIAAIRNKLSSSHGAGGVARTPTRQITRYALNTAASAMLLLAEETGVA